MKTIRSLTVLAALLAFVPASADLKTASMEISSGSGHVTLVELFTSEGCSSCPPAERWMNGLVDDSALWTHFVPVAFHVDYWDYIGWEDRFARPEFGARQMRYAEEGGVRTVYTPGMFADGHAWSGWRRGARIPSEAAANGELTLRIEGDDVAARFSSASGERKNLTLHLAILGMGLQTEVRRGENRGRTLRHDFVALWTTAVPLEAAGSGYRAIADLPAFADGPDRRAIVAWVSADGLQAPIQAVGGFLPEG